jgi:hypothetical protein
MTFLQATTTQQVLPKQCPTAECRFKVVASVLRGGGCGKAPTSLRCLCGSRFGCVIAVVAGSSATMGVWFEAISTMVEELWVTATACSGLRLFVWNNVDRRHLLWLCLVRFSPRVWLSYGHPWAHYSGGYQDRLLGGPLGLLNLCYMTPVGVERKDYRGIVLG